jgi:hypothetical protein
VAAQLHAVGGSGEPTPRLSVQTPAGRWAVLHAGAPPNRNVPVIIEAAAAVEVLPALLSA